MAELRARQLTKRFDESVLIKIGVLLQSIAFAALAFSPQLGKVGLYGASALVALGNGLTQPSIPAFISKRADPSEQGGTLGTNQSMSSLARMFGPALGGWLYGALGPSSPYLFGASGMAVAFVIALALSPQRKTSTQIS
jgi:MFS family permease